MGKHPTTISPDNSAPEPCTSAWKSSAWRTSWRASGNNCWAALVSVTPRALWRMNRSTPNSCSRSISASDKAAWERLRRCAARLTLPASAVATKHATLRRDILGSVTTNILVDASGRPAAVRRSSHTAFRNFLSTARASSATYRSFRSLRRNFPYFHSRALCHHSLCKLLSVSLNHPIETESVNGSWLRP